MSWTPTHYSRADGSPARLVGRYHKRVLSRALFENENGDRWVGDLKDWEALS